MDQGSRQPANVLREVLDVTSDAVLTVTDGDVGAWNQAATRLLGYEPADAVGRPVGEVVVAVDAESRDAVKQALSGQPVDRAEARLQRSDGQPVVVDLAARDVDGTTLVLLRDRTEQHETQQVLADVQSRLRDLEALGDLGLWHWDVRSGEVQWSSQLFVIHGRDPMRFGADLDAHLGTVREDARDHIRRQLRETATDGVPFAAEYGVFTPDGEERWLASRADPVRDPNGAVVAVRGIIQDVTESRRSLRAAQQARDDLDRFASTVAHDLKEPLTAIVGFADLLLDDDAITGDRRRFLERIAANADAAMGLVTDILAEARSEGTGDRDEVALDQVVAWVRETLAERLARTGSTLESAALPTVRGREALLRQCLLNVVGNAIKYRREGAGARIRIGATQDGSWWSLTVDDDGPGIPASDRERVFREGVRMDRDRSRGIDGTGIGLATVRDVVERQGGAVRIEDSPLGGARVVVRLPRGDEGS